MKKFFKSLGLQFAVFLTLITTLGFVYAAWNDTVNSGDPLSSTLWNDLVNKVITIDSDLSNLSNSMGNFAFPGGGSIDISGNITAATPTLSGHLATKSYVDAQIGGAGNGDITSVVSGDGLTGGAISGDVTLNVGAGAGISVSADTISATLGTTIEEGEINQNTLDDSEIEDNSLTANSLAANSVGNSELVDDPTVNTIYANSWFRSSGNTGWYNSTYGGGIHMEDSTWIRIYGSKWLYSSAGIRADGGGIRTTRICDTSGANCTSPSDIASASSPSLDIQIVTQTTYSSWRTAQCPSGYKVTGCTCSYTNDSTFYYDGYCRVKNTTSCEGRGWYPNTYPFQVQAVCARIQ